MIKTPHILIEENTRIAAESILKQIPDISKKNLEREIRTRQGAASSKVVWRMYNQHRRTL